MGHRRTPYRQVGRLTPKQKFVCHLKIILTGSRLWGGLENLMTRRKTSREDARLLISKVRANPSRNIYPFGENAGFDTRYLSLRSYVASGLTKFGVGMHSATKFRVLLWVIGTTQLLGYGVQPCHLKVDEHRTACLRSPAYLCQCDSKLCPRRKILWFRLSGAAQCASCTARKSNHF